MKTTDRLAHIEADQGVGYGGEVFGYDHRRLNYITWGIEAGKIVVVKVERDDEESVGHGSLAATLRDARSMAARENRLPGSRLRRSIQQGPRKERLAAGWQITEDDDD